MFPTHKLSSHNYVYDYEEPADEHRKEERLISTIKKRLGGAQRCGWTNYISILKAQKKSIEYSIDRVIFDNRDDTEKFKALQDTARLIAYLAGGKKKGKPFEIINLILALTYKNEEEMEIHLWEEYQTSIKCVPTLSTAFLLVWDASHPLDLLLRAMKLPFICKGMRKWYTLENRIVRVHQLRQRSPRVKFFKSMNCPKGELPCSPPWYIVRRIEVMRSNN